jgi:SAM-dependent methyltransferase
MFEQQPDLLRQRVKELSDNAQQQNSPYAWFEVLYAEAQGNPDQVPWAKLTPHPYLQSWLHEKHPVGDQKTALVIGCGLGDDAEAFSKLGFNVTAFDVSPTAIDWCKKRFPDSSVHYQTADLFHLDPTWQNSFDLVFECRNLQALPVDLRSEAVSNIGPLVAPQGSLLVITRIKEWEHSSESGPPWPLSEDELLQFTGSGLIEVERQLFQEVNVPVRSVRIEYQRISLTDRAVSPIPYSTSAGKPVI